MSSLKDRMRGRRGGRMHPGWACALMMHISGMMTSFGLIACFNWKLYHHEGWVVVIFGGIAIVTFILGGRKAETLDDTRHS